MSVISSNPQYETSASGQRAHGEGFAPEGSPGAKLRRLWVKRRFLGWAIAVGLVIGVLLALLLPRRYESTAQVMSPSSSSGSEMLVAALSGSGGSGLGSLAGGLLGAKSTGEEFVGILHSRTVADRLIQRFDLRKVYGSRLDEDAQKKLEKRTTIEIDRKSGIINIAVTDRDPQRARAIVQAYVQELDRLAGQLSASSAHSERLFLEARLKDVKQELDQAAYNFSQFASKNTAIDIPAQGKAMVEAASVLQGELIAAESELKGLEQIYAPTNVRVRTTQARVTELRRQLGKLGGPGPDEKSGADSGERASPYPSIRELPILGVQYADLFRQTKIKEAVYESLTKQYEMARVQEAKEIPSVRVLDPGNLPERTSFPPRMLVVFLSTCFCLMAAAGMVLARARWERIEAGDPNKVFAQEVLQTVGARMPWAPPNGSRWQSATHKLWVRVVGANRTEPAERASN